MSKSTVKAASEEHQELVKALIKALKGERFTITHAADMSPQYPEPSKVGRHEPDIRAINDQGLVAYGEAKTCEDLGNERTKEQFEDFSNRVMTSGKSKGKDVPLHIIIPKQCEDELWTLLKDLGLSSKPDIKRWSYG